MKEIEIKRSDLESRIVKSYSEFINKFGVENSCLDTELYFSTEINNIAYEVNIVYNAFGKPSYTNDDIQVVHNDEYVNLKFSREPLTANSIPLHSRLEKLRRLYVES